MDGILARAGSGRRHPVGADEFGDDENEFENASNQRDRDRRDFRETDETEEVRRGNEGEEASQEDDDNPFVRDARPPRNNNNRRNGRADTNGADKREEPAGGLDPASLPPAIGADSDSGEEQPRPRKRARRPRPAGDDEALEAVG